MAGANTEKTLRALVGKLTTAVSVIQSRANLAARAGITFGTDRDLYAALGYKRTITFLDYKERYRRGGIARPIVDAYPRATWRTTPLVREPGNVRPNKTEFETTFEELAKRLRLFHYMERVDRLAGIGQYATLLIGTRGGDLTRQQGRVVSPNDILFVSPFSEEYSAIKEVVFDSTDERFGLPESYNVTLTADLAGIGVKSLTKSVHASHMIHVADGLLEDEVFGTPRMRPCWNYLDDLEKMQGGSSEAVWKGVYQGLQLDIDKDLELNETDEAALSDEIDEYIHGIKRVIRTRGVAVKPLGSEVPQIEKNAAVTFMLIAGTTGIPSRILFGSERGQLASEQDERAFSGRVKERQESFAGPIIVEPFIKKMIEWGALPDVEFEVLWPDPSTLTAREGADVAARVGQAIANYARHVDTMKGRPLVTINEFRDSYLDLPPLLDDATSVVPPLEEGEVETSTEPVGEDSDDPRTVSSNEKVVSIVAAK